MTGSLQLQGETLTTPFLQAVQEYGASPTVDFFRFLLQGSGEGIFNYDSSYYEIYMLSGPDTTKEEFDILVSLNQTTVNINKPGSSLDDNLWSIMQKGAFRMLFFDMRISDGSFDSIIEQAYILGTDLAFGRVLYSWSELIAVGYWQKDNINLWGQPNQDSDYVYSDKTVL